MNEVYGDDNDQAVDMMRMSQDYDELNGRTAVAEEEDEAFDHSEAD